MGLQGCSCVERHKGHFVILLYFLLFGTGFLTSSSMYLHQLYEIDDQPVPECVLGLLTHSGDGDGTGNGTGRGITDCADVSWWKTIAWVGFAYGFICFLAALAKLFPIIRRLSSCGAAVAVKRLRRSRGTSLRDAAGGRAVARANAEVRQFVQERNSRSLNQTVESTYWSSCSQFTKICVKFVVIMNLWLISLVMPWYVAVNVFNSDGIRAKDEVLYYPALALFAISIISLAVSLASCVFILIEHDPGSWDDDDEEGECDRKAPEQTQIDGEVSEVKPSVPDIPEAEPLNPSASTSTKDATATG